MDDEGTLGIQNWGRYFRPPPLKGNLGLQLMSNVGERMTMPFLSDSHGGNYPRPECSIPDSFSPKRCLFPPKGIPELSSMSIDYARDIWYHNNNENGKIHHVFSGHHPHQHSNNFGALLPEATAASAGTNAPTLPMLQPVDLPKQEKTAVIEDLGVSQLDIVPLKKRSKGQGRPFKDSKQTTAKKAPRQGSAKSAGRRRRSANKNLDMVINGIDLDLSGIPAPLCTCTGHPQQCYRWGAGGWQSACCTTSISMYPLPMNNKRRGARIAGRKMSQGAFKKVLEKLAGEGQDFSNPIDMKPFWAKHGTNKFVTIR